MTPWVAWFSQKSHIDKYAKTGLLYKYLNYLFYHHMKECNTEPWIREGVLDEEFASYLYPNLTLKQLLHNTCNIPQNCPKTFVIRGSKGDGRVFFFKKMISCCIEHIPPYVTWEDIQTKNQMFRLPIFVTKEALQNWSPDTHQTNNEAIASLCCACIEHQTHNNEKVADHFIREIVDLLLKKQMLAVFFEQGFCESYEFSPIIISILNKMPDCPLAVFVEDKLLTPYDSIQQHYIDIGPVKDYQISSFLSKVLNEKEIDWSAKLKNHPELIQILSKPERLLMYVRFVRQPLSSNSKTGDISLNNIYDAFIQNEIALAAKYAVNAGKHVNDILLKQWLQNYAETQTPDEDYSLFNETDMFNKDGTFKFEGCKHYLTAMKYKPRSNPSKSEIRKAIQIIFKKKNSVEILCFFSNFFNGNIRSFKIFFNQLIEELKSKDLIEQKLHTATLLADVICASDSYEIVGDNFFDWATNIVDIPPYDNSISHALIRLANVYGIDKVAEKLIGQFKNTSSAKELQLRIVSYFSHAKLGFPTLLAERFHELDEQAPDDRHLSYHIIEALVCNYSSLSNNYEDYLTCLQNKLGNDYILKTNYAVLFNFIHKRQWMNAEGEHSCLSGLVNMLSTGENWEKFHVADALQRYTYSSDEEAAFVVNNMLRILEEEISTLSATTKANINNTYIVTYIVKTLCSLARNREFLKRTISTRFISLLEQHLKNFNVSNVNISVFFPLQTALSILLEGILYLFNDKHEFCQSIEEYYIVDEPLLSAFSKIQNQAPELLSILGNNIEDSVANLEENMSVSTISKHFMSDSPNAEWYDTSRLSLIQVHCKDWSPFSGFLFAYKRNIYAITCRHNFYDKYKNMHADVSNISFSLTSCSLPSFSGSLHYPERLNCNSSFNNHADDDLVIFKLDSIPACLYKAVFSVSNIAEPVLGGKINSITFIENDPINLEKMRSGSIEHLRGNGFFNIKIPDDPIFVCTDGFSGAPVFGDQSELYGMWKGSESNVLKSCINFQIILGKLKS